jgi:hypothetical protein
VCVVSENEQPADEEPGRDEPSSDDLVERARKLDERAHELEEEEHQVEELERDAREWLERQPKTHWPPLDPEADGDDSGD